MWLAIREEGYKNSVKNNNYEIQEKKKKHYLRNNRRIN